MEHQFLMFLLIMPANSRWDLIQGFKGLLHSTIKRNRSSVSDFSFPVWCRYTTHSSKRTVKVNPRPVAKAITPLICRDIGYTNWGFSWLYSVSQSNDGINLILCSHSFILSIFQLIIYCLSHHTTLRTQAELLTTSLNTLQINNQQ
jgi:hypothetical protein